MKNIIIYILKKIQVPLNNIFDYDQLTKIDILRLNNKFRQHFNAYKKKHSTLHDIIPVQRKPMTN